MSDTIKLTYSRGSPKKLNELDKRKLPRYENDIIKSICHESTQ